jgi:hypothetical protein
MSDDTEKVDWTRMYLELLVDNDGHGCRSAYKGTCHYCGMRSTEDHDLECPYPGAKAHLESLKKLEALQVEAVINAARSHSSSGEPIVSLDQGLQTQPAPPVRLQGPQYPESNDRRPDQAQGPESPGSHSES